MGLDIRATSNITVETVNPEIYVYETSVMMNETGTIFLNRDFPYHSQSFGSAGESVNYCLSTESETYHFSCGSYSSYNKFRNLLSLAVLGVKAETAWESGETYINSPLWDIINFSDCEGVIDTEICEKLLNEFKDNRDKFISYLKGSDDIGEMDTEHYTETYDEFIKAFELGAKSGFVEYC